MPRAILFDADGTLYSQRSLRARLLLRLAGQAALEPRLVRAPWSHRRAVETLRSADHPIAIPDRQFQLTAQLAGAPEVRVRKIVQKWFVEAPLPLLRSCVHPGLAGLLQLARDRGVLLGVFSDHEAEDKLKALGVRAVIVGRARGFPEFRRRLEESLLRRKQRFPTHAPPGVDRHPAQQ